MNKVERKQRVLVVDDHPKVLRFIEIDLKLHGYEVTTSSSGEKALELVKSGKPDIMLLDIIMPGIDGFEVLRQLRGFTQLPVIAISASSANYAGAIQLGASDFITKPFEPDEMVRRIEALLGQQSMANE
jgi:two-component system, OmpR family, KDP operon response regulator KdpE